MNGQQSGYRGSLQMAIDNVSSSPTLLTYGIKSGSVRETIEKHDLSATTSPVVNSPNLTAVKILQVPRLNGKASCRINCSAQWNSSGTGDPIQFGSNAIYGNVAVSYQAGDTVVGSFLVDDYANTLNVDGTVDTDWNLISNGAYTRSSPALS